MPVVRAPLAWRRGVRRGADAMATLAAGRRIKHDLRGGLAGAGVASAVGGLRALLDVDAVGLAGLDGPPVWSGPAVAERRRAGRARARARRPCRTRRRRRPAGARARRARRRAGHRRRAWRAGAAREAAAWVGEALERARLEASAEVAEQAELRALRAEISPHFVYNSLTTIASFVESDPERARDLMLEFAAYTRHSLAATATTPRWRASSPRSRPTSRWPRAVHGEKLRVQVRIAPEILPVAVPYLALQPLVENAVRHGVEATRPRGARAGGGRGAGERVRDHASRTTGRAWTPPTPPTCWPGAGGPGTSGWSTSTAACGRCSAPATG